MARPRLVGLQYFPLDCEFDEKVKALEMLHGNDGFAFIVRFWQQAYKSEDGVVDLSGLRRIIGAKTFLITPDKLSDIIRDCIELKLIFEIDPQKYTSTGVQKRIAAITKFREYDRNYAKKRLSERKYPDNSPITGEKEKEMEKKKEREITTEKEKTHQLRAREANDFWISRLTAFVESGPPLWITEYQACGTLIAREWESIRQLPDCPSLEGICEKARDYRTFVEQDNRRIQEPKNWLRDGSWRIDWKLKPVQTRTEPKKKTAAQIYGRLNDG